MKQIFVLNDYVLATAKQIGALAKGEIGAFGFDANGAWTPVAEDTASEVITFGIGSGNASPLTTMSIINKVKQASLTKSTYVAEVLPTITIVASVTSYTSNVMDTLNIKIDYEELHNQNIRRNEKFTINIPASATAALLHAAIAAEINAISENFTAVSNGATNVVLTAKSMGILKTPTANLVEFSRYSGAVATTAPTFGITVANGTMGVGTPAQVKEIVDTLYQRFGVGESVNRYERTSLIQEVLGTKYTLLRFKFTEDKETSPTVNTHFTENEIIFACDVSAGSPTTLVADLEDFIKYVFLEVPIPVV